MKTPNARFWVFWNGSWAKLTLRPGEELNVRFFSRDEEGCSYEHSSFTHEGVEIVEQWCNGGTDCDGRLERTGSRRCAIGFLRTAEPTEANGPMLPEWVDGPVDIYDQFAQAANY